eukprot:Pgem_evm1s6657
MNTNSIDKSKLTKPKPPAPAPKETLAEKEKERAEFIKSQGQPIHGHGVAQTQPTPSTQATPSTSAPVSQIFEQISTMSASERQKLQKYLDGVEKKAEAEIEK